LRLGEGPSNYPAERIFSSPALECVILSFPSYKPITPETMNYASIITIGVMVLSGIWYVCGANKHYFGPKPNVENVPLEVAPYEDQKTGGDDKDPRDYVPTAL
jgi:hypothetical protein